MSNGMNMPQRIILGAAAVVAVVGIGAVAYGAVNDSAATVTASAPVVVTAPAADAVPIAASVDGLSEFAADGFVFMREEEK